MADDLDIVGQRVRPRATNAEEVPPGQTLRRPDAGERGGGWASRVRRPVRDVLVVLGVAVLIGAALTILISGRRGASHQMLVAYTLISLCFVAAYTGLRREELFSLEWRDIDLQH